MIKLYFLLPRKTRLLIIWVLVLCILGTSGYFIFDYVNDTLQIIRPVEKKLYEAKLPVVYNGIDATIVKEDTDNIVAKEYSLETNTRKQDITNIVCFTNKTNDEYWRNFQCSILAKTWDDDGSKSKVLVVNFKDVSDYFAECSYSPIITANNNPKCVDETESNYEEWLSDVVFLKAKEFVTQIYRLASSGPELSLLESIDIIRGVGTDISETKNVLGKYDNRKISVYLSDSNDSVILNNEVDEAIKELNGQTSNYHRSKVGLLQTILHEYGHHYLTFNVDRTSILEITNTLNPRNANYIELLNSLESSFSTTENYNDFVTIVNLVNREITSTERDTLIALVQKYIISSDGGLLGKQVNALAGLDIQSNFFASCVEKKFQFTSNANLYTNDLDNSKRKQEFVDELKYWLSYDEILTRLYNVLTYIPQQHDLTTCPELTDSKFTVLSDYLSFKTLGLNPFASETATRNIMARLSPIIAWYDVSSDIVNKDVNFTGAIFRNKGNVDFIDSNVLPSSTISTTDTDNLFFITGDIQTTMGWVNSAQYGRVPFSLGISSLDINPRVSKYDWNNTFYKTSFMGTTLINIVENNNMQAFTSHYTTTGVTAEDINDVDLFIFEDVLTPNIYIGGDREIPLGFIRDIVK